MKTLWTDGSASPNPGPGGFAVIENKKPVALGNEPHTTNIRMEAKALISAINYAKEEGCEIYTDSQFWINVLTKWAAGWEKKGWRKSNNKPIQNPDLTQELWRLYKTYPVKLNFVYGHQGTTENELADEWANKARAGATIENIKE